MKVLVSSDRVPIILMIIGSAFVIVSSLSENVTDKDLRILLFPMGILIMILGFFLWAVPSFLRYQKRMSRRTTVGSRNSSNNADRPRKHGRYGR